jgi:uncharacterized protein with FMN-binding domain
MKKITLTVWFVALFVLYVAYERMNPAPSAVGGSPSVDQVASAAPATASAPPQPSSGGTVVSASSADSGSPPASPQPTAAAPTQTGQYRDGTYTGPSADAYYGNVKVEAIVSGGRITDVKFLEYPNTHAASVYINSQAMSYLTQEALQAQSANVDVISGATMTSEAFIQSLGAALARAKN